MRWRRSSCAPTLRCPTCSRCAVAVRGGARRGDGANGPARGCWDGGRPTTVNRRPASQHQQPSPLHPPQGLFGLAKRLFGVDIEPADGQVPVWHDDVRFFCVKKVGGQGKGGRAPDQWGPLVPPTSTPLALCAGAAGRQPTVHPPPPHPAPPIHHTHRRAAPPRPTSISTPTPALPRSAAAPGARGPAAALCVLRGATPCSAHAHAGQRAPLTRAPRRCRLLTHPPTPPRRMDEVCGQSRLFARQGEAVRLPVAHMVCNQTPPVGGKPSLMTFRSVWAGWRRLGKGRGGRDVAPARLHLPASAPSLPSPARSPTRHTPPPGAGRWRRCSTSLGTPRSTC